MLSHILYGTLILAAIAYIVEAQWGWGRAYGYYPYYGYNHWGNHGWGNGWGHGWGHRLGWSRGHGWGYGYGGWGYGRYNYWG
uniref:Foot protein 3 variant 1 n=1 Tax=Heterorhabditis bacteriophora TaxID=37862 RepID=A0A1I7XHQ2_HETBA